MEKNILIIGANYLNKAFQELGYQVFHVGLNSQSDFCLKHPMLVARLWERLESIGFCPDFLLYADNGNLPFVLNLVDFPCPALFYSIDTFCNPWHIPFSAAFDCTLVAQKDYVSLFTKEGWNAHWMPLFFPLDPLPQDAFPKQRDIPVSFVGTLHPRNIPDRWTFLQNFKRYQPIVIMQGSYTPIFIRSQIVLNQTAASEVNFRCFEAMAMGAALLMENCANGLSELFTPDETILQTYPRNNAKVAANIALQYLAKPEKLAEIAQAGQNLVLTKHTAKQRASEIIDLAKELSEKDAISTRLADLPRRRKIVSTAYGMIAAELTDPNFATLRNFFQKLCG